jgi:hypothetical protein
MGAFEHPHPSKRITRLEAAADWQAKMPAATV